MSAAIDDAPRDNKFDAPTIGRFLYLISGCLITINGFIFIGETFKQLGNCTGTSNCIGPALFWGSWTGGTGDGQNALWRTVFPLAPDLLFRNWTGVFLGLLMMVVHIPGFKFTFNTRSWLHVSFFSLFTVLFGAFPYSGNLGILVGFFTIPLVILSFFLAFTKYRHEPTTLNLRLTHLHCGCLVDNELFIHITRILSLVGGLAVMIVGFIHVFVQDFRWCPAGPAGTFDCVGPSLRWNPTNSNRGFLFPANGPLTGPGWGATIFTFAIETFCPLWGPVVLGYVTILQHVNGHNWQSISASWPRVFFWFMFIGLFGSLGYAGNLGILVGFYCITVAMFALAITLGGGANTKTHMEIHVYHFGANKVTMVTGGVKPAFELA